MTVAAASQGKNVAAHGSRRPGAEKARYLGPPRRPFRAVIGLGTPAYPGGGGQDTRIRDMCPDSASRLGHYQ